MKTLTDIARSIAQQAEHTPNADIDELCENYVTNRLSRKSQFLYRSHCSDHEP